MLVVSIDIFLLFVGHQYIMNNCQLKIRIPFEEKQVLHVTFVPLIADFSMGEKALGKAPG